MKKVPQLREKDEYVIFHTREDFRVLIQAYNRMSDAINELIEIVEKQQKEIEKLRKEGSK